MSAMNAARARRGRLAARSSVGVSLLSALIREPGGGEQVSNAALRPASGDLGEHVAEVLERRRVGEIAADDQRLQDSQAATALVAAGKEIVLPAQSSPALLLL